MDVSAAVEGGAFSQYGWIPQVRGPEAALRHLRSTRIWRTVYRYSSSAQERHTPLYVHRACLFLTLSIQLCNFRHTQIAPTLHPPLNISSSTASPMNWTVSLVRNLLSYPALRTFLKQQSPVSWVSLFHRG